MLPPAEHEAIKLSCAFSNCMWNPCRQDYDLKRSYGLFKDPTNEMKLQCPEESYGKIRKFKILYFLMNLWNLRSPMVVKVNFKIHNSFKYVIWGIGGMV